MFVRCLVIVITFLASQAISQTRTVTDDADRQVEIPTSPQRVVSTFDITITLALYELGIPLIGSTTRSVKADVFALQDLYSITSNKAGISSVGTGTTYDIERIAALNPDLIVAEQGWADIELLTRVAPVYVVNSFDPMTSGFNKLEALAGALNASDRFDTLHARYRARLVNLREQLAGEVESLDFIALMPLDAIYFVHEASPVVEVLRDLGYEMPSWVQKLTQEGSLAISIEEITKIDADLVILTNPYNSTDQSFQGAKSAMDSIMPKWEKFLLAARDDRLIHLEGRAGVVPTFAAAHRILDSLEQQLID